MAVEKLPVAQWGWSLGGVPGTKCVHSVEEPNTRPRNADSSSFPRETFRLLPHCCPVREFHGECSRDPGKVNTKQNLVAGPSPSISQLLWSMRYEVGKGCNKKIRKMT